LVLVSALYLIECKTLGLRQEYIDNDLKDGLNDNTSATKTKEELLVEIVDMLLHSQTVQELCKEVGKPLLAKALELIDEGLHKLDEKLQKINPKTEVGKFVLKALEQLVEKAEVDLEAEIKKIEEEIHPSTPLPSDVRFTLTKEELLIEIAEMLIHSKAVQDLCKEVGKPLLAKALELIDEGLHKLDEKVEKCEPKTEVGKFALHALEELIKKAEVDLEAEIKKIEEEIHPSTPSPANDIPDDLLKIAEALMLRAEDIIAELKQKGREVEAKALTVLEGAVVDAIQALKNFHPTTKVGELIQKSLEKMLKTAEDELDDYIQHIKP